MMQAQGGRAPNITEMNPQMMQGLAEITAQQLPMFLMSNPELVPEKHAKVIKKAVKNLATLSFVGFVAGSLCNILIKKVYIKFLAFPAYIRLPLRLGMFALPFGFLYGKLNENGQLIGENLATIHMKMRRLSKTGNIEEYFRI